jgi:small GTP-binding protein
MSDQIALKDPAPEKVVQNQVVPSKPVPGKPTGGKKGAKPEIDDENDGDPYYIRNVAVVGDTDIGKSCLLQRYCNQEFTVKDIIGNGENDYSTLSLAYMLSRAEKLEKDRDSLVELDHWATVGCEFYFRFIESKDDAKNRIRIQVIDTSGALIFKNLVNTFIEHADFVLVTYTCDEKTSFDRIPYWLGEIKATCKPDIKRILVGLRNDIPQREVEKETAKKFAEENNMEFFETSTLEWKDPNFEHNNDNVALFKRIDEIMQEMCTDKKLGVLESWREALKKDW